MIRALLVATVLVACGKPSEPPVPTCEQVTDHLLAVTKHQLVGHDDMILEKREVMVGQCEARNLTADKRRCLLSAYTLTEIAACKAGDKTAAPFDPRSLGEKPRRPRPPRQRE